MNGKMVDWMEGSAIEQYRARWAMPDSPEWDSFYVVLGSATGELIGLQSSYDCDRAAAAGARAGGASSACTD